MTRPESAPSWTTRAWVVGALALLVSIGAAAVIASIVDTADARFAGSTDNRGSLLGAGEVELQLVTEGADDGTVATEIEELAIQARDIVPGQLIQRCVVVAYSGSVDDADLRLYGRVEEGGGLEEFLDAAIEVGTGFDPACSDFALPVMNPVTWTGTLSELGIERSSYADGLAVLEGASSESTATVRVQLSVQSDNRAQGLSSAFWLVFEVRP